MGSIVPQSLEEKVAAKRGDPMKNLIVSLLAY